jgi:Carboxypeptidase regulatory-like domain/TonB dependent receptor-like, beta-barrel
MGRLHRAVTAVGAVVVIAVASGPRVQAQTRIHPEGQTVRLLRGSITGTVTDDRGGPLAGVVVSALGATMAMTVSDARGYYALDALPMGEYVVQAHLTGFAGSSRERVQVGAASPAVHRFQLRKLDAVVATTGTVVPVSARPIMAAGFGLPGSTLTDQPDSTTADASADHPHDETAWRLRHIKRSILKDSTSAVTFADGNSAGDDIELRPGSALWRAIDSTADLATSLFGDIPLSGEVNLLTSGAFAPGDLFSGDTVPRGVAYLSIGLPTSGGDWTMRAAMSEGELASWNVAGAFASHPGSTHTLDFGLTYSRQDYAGGNPSALAAVTDNSRNVGEVFAFDRWTVTPRLTVDYGSRYARYDYLQRGDLLSPRTKVSVEPFQGTRVVTSVAQRMVAPGAEEFLSTNAPGPWLPPERTFAPLRGTADPSNMRVERARTVGVGLEHEFKDASVVSVERFFQRVDDQLVTLFGLHLPGGPDSAGHYFVASAGGVEADGWAIRVSNTSNPRLKGSIDYSITRSRWQGAGDFEKLQRSSTRPIAWRPETEDLHDITTSIETAIPETATRVVVVYKVNTGYARVDQTQPGPGLDARFNVQLNQALPFDFAGTRWEILVGVRNLFRDPTDPASVYDELLVVRPPKRVVGGFLVRF